MIAVLRAAQTFTERLPTATTLAFLDYLEAQDFAADVLGARGQGADSVAFATPASAVGRDWDVVVVAGLDEGVWPNLRLRDSVLGSQRLAEALALGPAGAVERASGDRDVRQARREVLDDETRSLLVAVSRARRKLIVTAIVDGEHSPSRFVPVIESAAGVQARDAASEVIVADLRSVVARLRSDAARTLATGTGEQSVGPAATALARLAALGESTADPATWYGVADRSTDAGVWAPDAVVRVSPSRYDAVRRCPLRWALETVGGTRESSDAQNTGLMVHAIAEALPHGTLDELLAAFDEAWGDPPVTLPERTEYDKTRQMVVKLAGYLGTRTDVEVRTEERFSVQVDRAEIVGSADRLELGADGAIVVDLKTGAPISQADAEEHGQLMLYQLAANHGGFEGIDTVAGSLARVRGRRRGAQRLEPHASAHRRRRRARATGRRGAHHDVGGLPGVHQRHVLIVPSDSLVPGARAGRAGGAMNDATRGVVVGRGRRAGELMAAIAGGTGKTPTAEQVAVIEAPLSPTLVVAGAGSGKTETLSLRILYLLDNARELFGEDISPDEILCLTFTRKAAAEIAERSERFIAHAFDPMGAHGPVRDPERAVSGGIHVQRIRGGARHGARAPRWRGS